MLYRVNTVSCDVLDLGQWLLERASGLNHMVISWLRVVYLKSNLEINHQIIVITIFGHEFHMSPVQRSLNT